MIPKIVGLIMIIMAGISMCVLIACLVRGIYDHTEDYDDCEV